MQYGAQPRRHAARVHVLPADVVLRGIKRTGGGVELRVRLSCIASNLTAQGLVDDRRRFSGTLSMEEELPTPTPAVQFGRAHWRFRPFAVIPAREVFAGSFPYEFPLQQVRSKERWRLYDMEAHGGVPTDRRPCGNDANRTARRCTMPLWP